MTLYASGNTLHQPWCPCRHGAVMVVACECFQSTQLLLTDAEAALVRLDARKGEDVGEWARRLAADVAGAND